MSVAPQPDAIRVIAKYTFEGRNNDELSFSKNDVITVTQMLEEGGWWEGFLNGITGWFPSDFVGVIKTESARAENGVQHSTVSAEALEASQLKFRREVLLGDKGFMKKEADHLSALVRVQSEYLTIIRESQILTTDEFLTLSSNLADIVDLKKEIYAKLQNALLNEFEKVLKKEKIELRDFIAGLSLVFRHTEKYASLLQEVERNTPTSHPDRGDLHRAGSVYREIAEESITVRKQKELQLEFYESKFVEKTFGSNHLEKLGHLIHICSVNVKPDLKTEESFDRCLVLFEKKVLFLELSFQDNSYTLREHTVTSGLKVQKLDEDASLLLINGSSFMLTVNALSSDDYERLCAVMKECAAIDFKIREASSTRRSPTHGITTSDSSNNAVSPPKRPDLNGLSTETASNSGFCFDHNLEMILPMAESSQKKPPLAPNPLPAAKPSRTTKLYSGWCLRPYPNTRSDASFRLMSSASTSSIKLRKGVSIEEQEDAYLLKIVEKYCTPTTPSGSAPHPLIRANSSVTTGVNARRASSYPEEIRPQLIMADDEKIFVEEIDGGEVVMKEKSLVDTVYSLKDQLTQMQKEFDTVCKVLEKEQKARRRLEEAFRRLSSGNAYSHSSTPRPTEQPESNF